MKKYLIKLMKTKWLFYTRLIAMTYTMLIIILLLVDILSINTFCWLLFPALIFSIYCFIGISKKK